MLLNTIASLGLWSWWIFGLALLVAELFLPGVFLVWVGAAAISLGLLSLALWDTSLWTWQAQMLLFAVLSVAFALIGRRYYSGRDTSDEPLLNQRGTSLIGRTATLHEPITDGRGRIRLDDTWWSVSGPELAAGTRVRISSATGGGLTVEEA